MTTFPRTDRSLISRWWWTVDHWAIVAIIGICAIGLVLTMAASPAVAERLQYNPFYFAHRQFIYIPLAIGVMLVTSFLSPKGVQRMALVVLVLSFILTAATPFLGEQVKGATRWLNVFGLSLQPSEFLKPSFAVVSAWLIASSRQQEQLRGYAMSIALLIGVATLLLVQPDVGTTVLVLGAWAIQIFLAGCPLVVIALLTFGGLGAAVAAYFTFSHVHMRVDQFLDPAVGEGYQVKRALEAFHAGGLFGRGPGEGRVKEVLPDAHADFIFAVAGEEFGLIVCLIIVLLFAFVVLRSFIRAFKDEDVFVILAGGALIALFGMQALMNMASAMHLIPPKGTTLPFISYGGSASLALAWAMGLLLALTRERPHAGGIG
ncbi:MAG: putative peptidoglycan glycosyltransferase FtsW [Rhodospirillales bacterium]